MERPLGFRLRLMAALVAVLAVPLAIALLVLDAPLRDELLIAAVALPIGIGAAVLASRELAQPLHKLAEHTEALARGEDRHPLALEAGDELGRLAAAVADIVNDLRARDAAIERSQDEVQASVRRLGEILRSTHDLMKLLSVVLETALVAVRGTSGAVFLFSTRRSELTAKVARHLDPVIAEKRIPVGEGIAGWVAQHARGVRLPANDPDAPVPTDPEPSEITALAVPLESQSQVLGVLAIYGRAPGGIFRDDDLETLSSLARQAAIGIDNVILHQEAQRLSITDGLTSIWNHRYFQMRLSQEFAAAKRFGQSLSLLWIDLDDFKLANDRYGHQRGDAILIELASRVAGEIREVDTLARYGGEEFVLILPHIDREGARIAAERIRGVVAATPFGQREEDEPIPVTVSIGFASYPDDGATQEALLNAADKAMYVAKAKGKNQVVGAGGMGHSSLAPLEGAP